MAYGSSLDEDLVHHVGAGGDHRPQLVAVVDLGGPGAGVTLRRIREPSGRQPIEMAPKSGAVRGIAVDRTLAVPTARSSRHTPDGTPTLALG